jgi:hypothetical protein
MAKQWESEGSTLPKNQYYLQQLLMCLDNNQHIIVCDQGVLGGIENARYLLEKGFKFIMTCRPTRPSFLWSSTQKNLEKGKFNKLHNTHMIGISYSKNDIKSGKKIINFLTNINGMDEITQIRQFDKKTKLYKVVNVPKVLYEYRKLHGGVDKRKQYESYSRNHLRARYEWRSELNNHLYLLLTNAYVFFKLAKNITTKYSITNFVVALCVQIRKPLLNSHVNRESMSTPTNNIVLYHNLSSTPHRQKCQVCGKRVKKYCNLCQDKPFLHDGECSLRYHNPNITINNQ